ncbi:hypothetical protein [Flavobacterium sp. CS20]|uniref:hypothetical protein n=1 Tax=Flavobacterium sp. CS20 TaxID=2775246 RepID=UPI001B3A49B6|nr:hypothetical protein [Flavobacterium sp. CS20]QTY28203.1 hypothetical protein IGB25_06945 [Flavobacterium sp. CS20]
MRLLKSIQLIIFLFAIVLSSYAQPFTLKDKIKPVKLELLQDTRKGHEGEKGIVYFNRLTDSTMYHYVTGHDMYEFVDVLVTSVDGSPLRVSLVKNNWNENQEKQNTLATKDGVVDFKIRTWGSFGIKVETDNPNNSLYNITVLASPPKKSYLGSAFRKIKKSEMKSKGNASADGSDKRRDGNSGGNTILYILLGVALLVIGLLAGKLLVKKGKNTMTIFMIILTIPLGAYAQTNQSSPSDNSRGGEYLTMEEFEQYKAGIEGTHQNLMTKLSILESERKAVDKFAKKLDKTISTIRKTWEDAKKLIDVYKNGFGDCFNSTPPVGSPTIPSICTDLYFDDNGELSEEQDAGCASCFLEARKKFNNMRYQFEKLATIYKCTKDFSDAAISFGDNVSGFTPGGVGGLAWQTQRMNIKKSVTELEQAYDNKYGEFLHDLVETMMELNICEAKYGVEDWYDRFGYVYFEFMRDKYKRTD